MPVMTLRVVPPMFSKLIRNAGIRLVSDAMIVCRVTPEVMGWKFIACSTGADGAREQPSAATSAVETKARGKGIRATLLCMEN